MDAGADDYLTKPYDPEALATRLIAAERVTALHHRLAAQQAELERLNGILRDDSRRDHLTGLGNRLRQDEDLAMLASRAERYGHGFAVVLLDIDRFKAYNDAAGHLAGDDVLRIRGRRACPSVQERRHRLPLRRRGTARDPARAGPGGSRERG